jgi:hypothetical protein
MPLEHPLIRAVYSYPSPYEVITAACMHGTNRFGGTGDDTCHFCAWWLKFIASCTHQKPLACYLLDIDSAILNMFPTSSNEADNLRMHVPVLCYVLKSSDVHAGMLAVIAN